MPNLVPPVTTVAAAAAYRARILAALPAASRFAPLMTLYLTDATLGGRNHRAPRRPGFVHACKYYPAGATTHSAAGVTKIDNAWPAFAAMEREGVVLSLHGEVTDPDVDVFDRERVFVERHLARIVADFPALRIVVEHVTTREAVQFVQSARPGVAATITPQHLLYSRNSMLAGFIRPHLYCLPILKRDTHRQALVAAATSGNPKFFLGTDSAPHARHAKESACGCAGCYSAPAAHRALCGSVRCRRRARQARRLRELPRRRLLRAAAQCRYDHAAARGVADTGRSGVRQLYGGTAARG